MKTAKRTALVSLLLLLVASCATSRQEVQRVVVHDKFVERTVRDSIFLHDSISLVRRADTVFLEKMRTLYRDRVRVDTVFQCDTLYTERVVTIEKKDSSAPSFRKLALLLLFLFLLVKILPQKLWNFLKKI